MLLNAVDNGTHLLPSTLPSIAYKTPRQLPLQKQNTSLSTLITHINPLSQRQPDPAIQKEIRRKYCQSKTSEENIKKKKYAVGSQKLNPKICSEEDELVKFVFAILIPMLIGSIILYIHVIRPLSYEKP